MMLPAFEQLCLLLAFMAIGFFFGRSGLIDQAQAKILSVVGVYLFLPCTIFNSFSKSFTVQNLRLYTPLFLGSLVVLLVLLVFSKFTSKALTQNQYQRGVFFYSLIVPNYGHMGYAMAEGLFGAEGLLYLILFSLPVSLFTYTVGYSILTKRPLNFKKLYNPVTMALFFGILFGLSGLKLPALATTFLSKSAACMAPTGMLLAGLTISAYNVKAILLNWRAYIVCFLRLLFIPVAIALVLRAVTDNTILIQTAVLFYSMPCGLNTIIFPKLVNEDCSNGASLAMLSSVLAMATIPLCLSLI